MSQPLECCDAAGHSSNQRGWNDRAGINQAPPTARRAGLDHARKCPPDSLSHIGKPSRNNADRQPFGADRMSTSKRSVLALTMACAGAHAKLPPLVAGVASGCREDLEPNAPRRNTTFPSSRCGREQALAISFCSMLGSARSQFAPGRLRAISLLTRPVARPDAVGVLDMMSQTYGPIAATPQPRRAAQRTSIALKLPDLPRLRRSHCRRKARDLQWASSLRAAMGSSRCLIMKCWTLPNAGRRKPSTKMMSRLHLEAGKLLPHMHLQVRRFPLRTLPAPKDVSHRAPRPIGSDRHHAAFKPLVMLQQHPLEFPADSIFRPRK